MITRWALGWTGSRLPRRQPALSTASACRFPRVRADARGRSIGSGGAAPLVGARGAAHVAPVARGRVMKRATLGAVGARLNRSVPPAHGRNRVRRDGGGCAAHDDGESRARLCSHPELEAASRPLKLDARFAEWRFHVGTFRPRSGPEQESASGSSHRRSEQPGLGRPRSGGGWASISSHVPWIERAARPLRLPKQRLVESHGFVFGLA